MIIRKFETADTEKVVDVWDKCGLLYPANDPYMEIRNKTSFQPDLFLVGESDGQVMASVMIGYEGRRGWINYLAVLPEYQGKGYGRTLVEHSLELLKEIGAPKVNLLVRPTNTKVQAFYEKCGFEFEEVTMMSYRFPEK